MRTALKVILVVVAVLLILNGLINISDNDGAVLAYDITSILSGAGLGIVAMLIKR